MSEPGRSQLLPALLKHWRSRRGMSQLDLSIAADVSARHISFVETGRSVPSAAMVMRLAGALGIPLRHVDELLRAAGHEPIHDVGADEVPPEAARALALLLAHHEPFPAIVIDRGYDVLDANRGAVALLARVGLPSGPVDDPTARPNLARMVFDRGGALTALVNADEVARELLWRLQREVLDEPADGVLRSLLDELLALPAIADDWRRVDLTTPASPAVEVHLRLDDVDVRFLTAVTVFQGPQHVALDELRIEQWFPVDEVTAAVCRRLVDALPS